MEGSEIKRTRNKILGGVCGGIAKKLGVDVVWVRVAYVFVSIISAGFPGALIYVILWLVLPSE